MRSGARSAAPLIGAPSKLWPTSTTSLRSSHLRWFTTSATKVSSAIDADSRCFRSPRPVWVGVVTLWPRAHNTSATRLQHQPPCHMPWTSTNVRDDGALVIS